MQQNDISVPVHAVMSRDVFPFPFLFRRVFTFHPTLNHHVFPKPLTCCLSPCPLPLNFIFPCVKVPDPPTFEEEDDAVIVGGFKISKPFVEKPVDGENHDIYVYYPRSAGGGSKHLFRKIGDESSSFHPEQSRVRRDGSYIYEQFMNTEGTDVKV